MTRLSAFEGIEDQVVVNDKIQDDQNRKKRKRRLELLSVTCSMLGMNLIIASFLGLIRTFGFTSPEMVFYSAFAFLLVSIVSGTMALLLSAPKYESMRSLIDSTLLLHTFFRWPQIQKNESSEKISGKKCEVSERSRPLFSRNSEGNEASQTTLVHLRDTVSTASTDLAFNKDIFKKNYSSPDLRSIHLDKAQVHKNESSHETSRKMYKVSEKSRTLFTRNSKGNEAAQATPIKLQNTASTDSTDLAFKKDIFKKRDSFQDLKSVHFDKAAYSMPSTQSTKVLKDSDDSGIATDFLPSKHKLKNSRDLDQDERKYSIPKLVNKLSNINSKNSLISRSSSEQNGIYHQPKNISNSKTLLQLKRRGICLFGETSIMQSSTGVLKNSRFILYDVEKNDGRTLCVPSKQVETYYADVDMKSPEKITNQRQMLSHRTDTEFASNRNHNPQSIWGQNFRRNFNSSECYGEMPQDKVLEVASKLNKMNFVL